MSHYLLNYFDVGFILAKSWCKRMSEDMAGESWNHNRFSLLLFSSHLFFWIMCIHNSLDCPVYCCWVMWHPKSVCKYKIGHSIHILNAKAFLLLSLIFFLKHIIYLLHHRYSTITCFRLWQRYSKLTFIWIIRSLVIG